MALEPASRRAAAFFDGQNLFHAVRQAFGYTYPNYDPVALAEAVCQRQGWQLCEVRFYTGVPDPEDDSFWHHFWTRKLTGLGRRGVAVFSRALRYRNRTVRLPNGVQSSATLLERKKELMSALPLMSSAWPGNGPTM